MGQNGQRDMSGALFREAEKKSDRHPDYRGNLTIRGEVFRLSGWVKETRDGKKYLSLAVSEDQGRVPAGRRTASRPSRWPTA